MSNHVCSHVACPLDDPESEPALGAIRGRSVTMCYRCGYLVYMNTGKHVSEYEDCLDCERMYPPKRIKESKPHGR